MSEVKYNPENGYRVNWENPADFDQTDTIEQQLLLAIHAYALQEKNNWENQPPSSTSDCTLIGYSFGINKKQMVFEVYPVYQDDEPVISKDITQRSGKRITAFHTTETGVSSWDITPDRVISFE